MGPCHEWARRRPAPRHRLPSRTPRRAWSRMTTDLRAAAPIRPPRHLDPVWRSTPLADPLVAVAGAAPRGRGPTGSPRSSGALGVAAVVCVAVGAAARRAGSSSSCASSPTASTARSLPPPGDRVGAGARCRRWPPMWRSSAPRPYAALGLGEPPGRAVARAGCRPSSSWSTWYSWALAHRKHLALARRPRGRGLHPPRARWTSRSSAPGSPGAGRLHMSPVPWAVEVGDPGPRACSPCLRLACVDRPFVADRRVLRRARRSSTCGAWRDSPRCWTLPGARSEGGP